MNNWTVQLISCPYEHTCLAYIPSSCVIAHGQIVHQGQKLRTSLRYYPHCAIGPGSLFPRRCRILPESEANTILPNHTAESLLCIQQSPETVVTSTIINPTVPRISYQRTIPSGWTDQSNAVTSAGQNPYVSYLQNPKVPRKSPLKIREDSQDKSDDRVEDSPLQPERTNEVACSENNSLTSETVQLHPLPTTSTTAFYKAYSVSSRPLNLVIRKEEQD